MLDDHQLLRRYALDGSEAAFGELVARYVDLVYSTALRRMNGDTHLAQDVAQVVFTDLARKSGSLPEGTVLAGWLHRATRYAAAQWLRAEHRRRAREQEAVTMKALEPEPEPDWAQIGPLLDQALDHLNRADRDALLLRFFEQRSLAEVGRALGSNEDAARKRVSRALEKVRAGLVRRGVVTTGTALSTVIAAHAVQAAPVGLTATLAAAAMQGTAVTSSAFTLIQGALNLMAWTKLKTTLILGAGTLLVGTTIVTTTHFPSRRLDPVEAAGATQTAREFFEAVAKADWPRVGALCITGKPFDGVLDDRTRAKFIDLELIRLGRPYTSRSYAGVFVPYEIRFKDGKPRRSRLAVRQDNPERRWYWDGGL